MGRSDHTRSPPHKRRGARAVSMAAVVLLMLAGCSSETAGGSDAGSPTASATPTVSATATPTPTPTERPYLPVPKGVELTEQGSDLRVGDAATVAWEPRKEVVGALRIKVTRLERGTLKDLAAFRLAPAQRRAAPYYVHARVENVGRTDLAELGVPLYLVNRRDLLIQATRFAAVFKPCPGEMLPKPFRKGARAMVCLVYLVPDGGQLKAVTFRPTKAYDPISWTGEVRQPEPVGVNRGRQRN